MSVVLRLARALATAACLSGLATGDGAKFMRPASGDCVVSQELGCYKDCNRENRSRALRRSAAEPLPECGRTGERRLLGVAVLVPDRPGGHVDIGSHENCLDACCAAGISGTGAVAGVEDAGQCFCASSFAPPTGSLRPSQECASPCTLNKTQHCGKDGRIVVFRGSCSKSCQGPPSPPPPTRLPLANSTYLVFNSSISPLNSSHPVTCYRGGTIIQTPMGLYAFAQGRIGHVDTGKPFKPSCDDCVISGIAMRRSSDGGRSWGAYIWALEPKSWDPEIPDTTQGAGGGQVVWDSDAKKLLLQFNRGYFNQPALVDNKHFQLCNPAGANWQQSGKIAQDGTVLWSKPADVSDALGQWTGSLVNDGLQLQGKGGTAFKGRLLWCGHWGMYNTTCVWYSDDGGHSYKMASARISHMDECALAELEDGKIMLNMRNNHFPNYANGSSCHCRGVATSTDGGQTFSALGFDPALISPVCQASLSTAGGVLLFSNPANGGDGFASDRDQGTIKKSTDGAREPSFCLIVFE